MEDKIQENQDIVFGYLKTTIEVMSDEDYAEIDWHAMAKFLSLEMIENATNFEKWLTRAHSLSGLYGNHKITLQKKRRKQCHYN